MIRPLLPVLLLVLATAFETGGDAIIRLGLMQPAWPLRMGLMLAGAATLYCYGLILNLAPLDWGRLMGAYVATFFVAGQILNLVVFRTAPSLPILVGGFLIIAGGVIITVWRV